MSLYRELLKGRVVNIEPIINISKLYAIIPNTETKIIFLEMLSFMRILPILETKSSRYHNLQFFAAFFITLVYQKSVRNGSLFIVQKQSCKW